MSRTTKGKPVDARKHWDKARRFCAAARKNFDAEEWDPSTSNAVLGAIHAASALSTHYLGYRSSSSNHEETVYLVERIRELDPEVRGRFLSHLHSLVAAKSNAQYSAEPVGKEDAKVAIQHMERALKALRNQAGLLGWPAI